MANAQHIPPDELHVWLEDKLRAEGRDDLADVLKKCRVQIEIECLCCGSRKRVNKGCKKRWCPVCGPKVTAARYARVAPIAARMQWPLAVMLSMVNPRDIAGCVEKLASAFRGFRKTEFWKKTVRGGFVGYEMTHTGNGVHVHLHMLIDCPWLAVTTRAPLRHHNRQERERRAKAAQAELSAVWAGYLGQPQAVVWVRRADKNALAETIKYPFKPANFQKLKCSVSEIIDEIDDGRRVASFGNCHGSAKSFLGRDPELYIERLCPTCFVDRSFVPADVIDGWVRGRSAPTKRQAALYWADPTKLDEAAAAKLLKATKNAATPIDNAKKKKGVLLPIGETREILGNRPDPNVPW